MIDLDSIKPKRATIDWLLKHYKNADNEIAKVQLNKISKQICKLAKN